MFPYRQFVPRGPEHNFENQELFRRDIAGGWVTEMHPYHSQVQATRSHYDFHGFDDKRKNLNKITNF